MQKTLFFINPTETLTDKNAELLINMLKYFEGFKPSVYTDTTNNATIGYGHKLHSKELIRTLNEEEATNFLIQDIKKAEKMLYSYISKENLQKHPQHVIIFLIQISFNMGYNIKQFKEGKNQLKSMNYGQLKENFSNSLWAKQVKIRRTRPTLKLLTTSHKELFNEFA